MILEAIWTIGSLGGIVCCVVCVKRNVIENFLVHYTRSAIHADKLKTVSREVRSLNRKNATLTTERAHVEKRLRLAQVMSREMTERINTLEEALERETTNRSNTLGALAPAGFRPHSPRNPQTSQRMRTQAKHAMLLVYMPRNAGTLTGCG